MLEKRRIFLLVICFAALCLSAAPAMADFVELLAGSTQMTVTDTSGGGGTSATATVIAADTIKMSLKDSDDLTLLQPEITVDSSALNATLYFEGTGGNDYTATGSLEMSDIDTKIAADFVSTTLTFDSSWNQWAGTYMGTLNMTGYLTTQENETSILLGDSPWEFGTISLSDPDPSLFTHGNMIDFHYNMQYETLQEFLAKVSADGSGLLNAQIYSTPIPAAVLLGIIGLGVAGLKLRKHA